MTTIWIDSDACPVAVKNVVFRAADKRGVDVRLVANRFQRTPPSRRIQCIQVGQGYDVADDLIAARATPGDLVITQDIPLAAQLVEHGVAVIDLRGRELDSSNVGERLSMRNLKDEMRSAGLQTGGPPAYGEREKQAFANAFDRVLTRLLARAP